MEHIISRIKSRLDENKCPEHPEKDTSKMYTIHNLDNPIIDVYAACCPIMTANLRRQFAYYLAAEKDV